MVKVIGTEKRTSEKGEFNILILQGGAEIVMSKATGKAYVTAHKVKLPSTFDERSAKELIGTSMPGKIVKEACVPYEYKIPQTGELVTLDFTYRYSPEAVSMEEAAFA